MLQQAYGDQCFSRTICFEVHERFASHTSASDDPRIGQPSAATSQEVCEQLVKEDHLVYDDVVPPHTSVTGQYYSQVRKVLHLDKLQSVWILHQDGAPDHTILVTQDTLQQSNVETLPHPPCS